MDAPTTVRSSDHSGLLDVAVRYGVLLAVVTYAVGLVVEWATASRLGLALADFPLTDRRILVSGGAILISLAVCVGMSACAVTILRRKGSFSWFSVATLLLVPLLFWPALWLLRVHVTSSDHMSWKFVASAIVLSWGATWMLLSSYEVFPPLARLPQTALLTLTLVFLMLSSVESGDVAAETLLRGPKVHLLLSPDSVAGARQLGIFFLEQPDGTPAQLTEEVRIVYIGDRTLLIQLGNGRMVQYSRDRILGAVRHSRP